MSCRSRCQSSQPNMTTTNSTSVTRLCFCEYVDRQIPLSSRLAYTCLNNDQINTCNYIKISGISQSQSKFHNIKHGESVTESVTESNRYKMVTRENVMHSVTLNRSCSTRVGKYVEVKMSRISSHLSLLLLFLLYLLLEGSHASECKIPHHTRIKVTFNDLETDDGAMYKTCFNSAAVSSAHLRLRLHLHRLRLPPHAALMLYADGKSNLINKSCMEKCASTSNKSLKRKAKFLTKVEIQENLIEEVEKLEHSLETEIRATERFFASNQRIERSKRNDNNNKNMKFKVSIDRSSIEKLTRVKEFASGNHFNGKIFDKDSGSDNECMECPQFVGYQSIELYVRLNKPLSCPAMDSPCPDRPDLELSVAVYRAPLTCHGGYEVTPPPPGEHCLVGSPSNISTSSVGSARPNMGPNVGSTPNMVSHAGFQPFANMTSRCIVVNCRAEVMTGAPVGAGQTMLLENSSVGNGDGTSQISTFQMVTHGIINTAPQTKGLNNNNLIMDDDEASSNSNLVKGDHLEVNFLQNPQAGVCVWEFNTTTSSSSSHKLLQLTVSPSLRGHVTVYEETLLQPMWKLEFCEQRSGGQYLRSAATRVFVVYDNPRPLDAPAGITVTLHDTACPPPPHVEHATAVLTAGGDSDGGGDSNSGGSGDGNSDGGGNGVSSSGSERGGKRRGSVLVYTCVGRQRSLQGAALLRCHDGVWQPAPPSCVAYPPPPGRTGKAMSDSPDTTASTTSLPHRRRQHHQGRRRRKMLLLESNTTAVVLHTVGVNNENETVATHPSFTNVTSYLNFDTIHHEQDNYHDDYHDYDYNNTDYYDYLPEFNDTNETLTTVSSIDSPAILLNGGPFNRTTNISTFGEEEDEEMNDMRRLLRALSIDDEMIFYLIIGCCTLLLLMVLLSIVAVIVYKRRYPVRLGLGRKFDTFQNPIYEKTMVRVPMQVELEAAAANAGPEQPSKAEMEDLSDSAAA